MVGGAAIMPTASRPNAASMKGTMPDREFCAAAADAEFEGLALFGAAGFPAGFAAGFADGFAAAAGLAGWAGRAGGFFNAAIA